LGHCMHVAVLSGEVYGQNQIKSSITFTMSKLTEKESRRGNQNEYLRPTF